MLMQKHADWKQMHLGFFRGQVKLFSFVVS